MPPLPLLRRFRRYGAIEAFATAHAAVSILPRDIAQAMLCYVAAERRVPIKHTRYVVAVYCYAAR